MKLTFSFFYTFLIFSFASAQSIEKQSIHFDFDSYQLSSESEIELSEMYKLASSSLDYSIELIGHTDQDGNYDYNNLLASKRAEAVYNYFISKDVPPSKISYLSKGEYELLYKENDAFSKSQNRRVEIITKIFHLNNIEDLMTILSPESSQQDFAIIPTLNQTISGKEGTEVEIPENAFVFEDGSSPKGPVKISLTEAFDFNSFMKHDLSCSSEGELLETGGMIKITAYSEGRELKIKEGQEIAITYPESQIKTGMELFYGEANEQGVSNWEVAGKKMDLATPKLDEKILAEIDLKSLILDLEEPKIPVFDLASVPKKPRYPSKPYKPYQPKIPKKENIFINTSFKDKIFLSQKKKDEMLETEYQRRLEIYKQKRINYEEKLAAYTTKIANFDTEIQRAELEIEKWEKQIKKAKYDLSYYYEKLDVYKTSKIIYIAQKYLAKNLNDPDTYRILTNYEKLLYRKDFTIDNAKAKKYYHSLYGNTRYFHKKYRYDYKYGNRQDVIVDESLEKQRDENRKIRKAPQAMISKISFAMKKDKSIHDIGKYATSISSLGWINCDRFRKVEEEDKRELALTVDSNTKMYLAFRDMNSILTPTKIGNDISFKGIPSGERVTLVGIKLENKVPYVFYQEMTVDGNEKLTPSFKASSLEEITTVFESLGS